MKEPETKDVMDAMNRAMKEGKGLEFLNNTIADIDDKDLKEFFDSYLATHPELTLAKIIKEAGIDRNYGYQIVNGQRKTIGRDKIIALCFCAGMTLEDTNRALRFSNNEELYIKNNRDAAIIFALNMKSKGDPNYKSIIKLNDFLVSRGEAELEL